jgi:D-cysteine desulfhydrase
MPVINEFYPALEKISWIKLGNFPSKIEKLNQIGDVYGFKELFIKRDDCAHDVYGGNKVRKLEYIIADALQRKRETLVTLGAAGSNQVLATGIFGSQYGFKTVGIMLGQPNSEYVRKNLLLDKYYEVELIFAKDMLSEMLALVSKYLKTELYGGKPYFVTGGASSPIGNLGFVNAAFELKNQIETGKAPEPDYIIVACGSIGTSAGLNLGCKLAGLDSKVVAVRIGIPLAVTKRRMRRMIGHINDFMRKYDKSVPKLIIKQDDLILLEDYMGKEYGYFTEEGYRIIKEMQDLEGIPLEPTYTGKALAGGLDWLKNIMEHDKTVLFWNTYNSIDLSEKASVIDYETLPPKFHKYFEEPTQDETFKRYNSNYSSPL